jgi:hypothetical protein
MTEYENVEPFLKGQTGTQLLSSDGGFNFEEQAKISKEKAAIYTNPEEEVKRSMSSKERSGSLASRE